MTLIKLLAAARRPALLLLALTVLAACGQKGDLVRPNPKAGIAVEASTAKLPANERATPAP